MDLKEFVGRINEVLTEITAQGERAIVEASAGFEAQVQRTRASAAEEDTRLGEVVQLWRDHLVARGAELNAALGELRATVERIGATADAFDTAASPLYTAQLHDLNEARRLVLEPLYAGFAGA